MKILHCLLAVALLTLPACSLFRGGRNEGNARIYEGDSNPNMRFTDYDEGPGMPVRN